MAHIGHRGLLRLMDGDYRVYGVVFGGLWGVQGLEVGRGRSIACPIGAPHATRPVNLDRDT